MNRRKRKRGSTIVEFVCAMVLLFPILLAILLVTVEASTAYSLFGGVDSAARRAARMLAVAYGQDPSIVDDPAKQQAVLSQIRIKNIVNDNVQFSQPVWDMNFPSTVTIGCTYTSGQNGLAVFPNPDPLRMGANLVISGTATCRLQ